MASSDIPSSNTVRQISLVKRCTKCCRSFPNTTDHFYRAGKTYMLPENRNCFLKGWKKQRMTRSHGIRDRKNGRLRRLHLPVAYPRSDLASLRYPSPQRFWITGRLQPLYHTCRLFQGRLDTSSAKR